MEYREAKEADAIKIAHLHTISWQENYRGAFSDHYLDHEVLPNRIAVWQERLGNPPANQHVILAEENNEVVGFVCAYLDEDEVYGAYLDNLHVSSKVKEKGIGSQLMNRLAKVLLKNNNTAMYLWVLEDNDEAILFYNNLKGKALDRVDANDIGDANFIKVRYVWSDVLGLHEYITAKLKAYEC